ncbi:hypothetical protein K7432_003737 [Basidiobolus ranarum]|uniref:Uncharacterized protein n=1 Tax=Basidiobolus ranarum TaxID=34480 RepID=A0ABR2W6J6_9FUNG
MALVERWNQGLRSASGNGHRLSISLNNLSRFYTRKAPEREDSNISPGGSVNRRSWTSEDSSPEINIRSRQDSISSTSSDLSSCKEGLFHLENEEMLVDFYNTDISAVPSLLLWKRSIGDSISVSEANYTHQALNVDVQTQEILNVSQLTDRRIVVVINDHQLQRTEIFIEYATTLNSALAQRSPKLILKRMYDLVGLNFVRNMLAVYSHADGELALVSCKRDSVEVINSACVFASGCPQSNRVKKLMFVHGSSELCMVTEYGLRALSLSTHYK